MSAHPQRRIAALAISALTLALAGCQSSHASPLVNPSGSASSAAPSTTPEPRAALAVLAAEAQDRRETVIYQLTSPGRSARSVVVTRATDGGWRVDIAQGALGGTADVSVARLSSGLFQCALASGTRLITPFCVKAAKADGRLRYEYDPQVQHMFVDWLDPFTDRRAAISVAPADKITGADGDCYSVESNAASLVPPVDPGVYCYRADGLLTAASNSLGTLVIVGTPTTAPPTIVLPGTITDSAPLTMKAPKPAPNKSDR